VRNEAQPVRAAARRTTRKGFIEYDRVDRAGGDGLAAGPVEVALYGRFAAFAGLDAHGSFEG